MILKEVELGEDIKESLNKCADYYNLSGIEDIDDNKLYLVEKHIGFYEPEGKSGLFLLSLEVVDEELIKEIW